jgi:leucine dehydrogenase
MLPYPSRDEGLEDVLRLSKGMSYKSALAGLGFGGGKSVIFGDERLKSPALFNSFGQLVETLNGKYIAAKDMGITSEDLMSIKKKTRHVLGIDGEPGSSGDPSPITARGILRAIEAVISFLDGSKSLAGKKIARQGLGYVGFALAKSLRKLGAELWVADVNSETLNRAKAQLGVHVVSPDSIYDVECDVFSPGARGAILNQSTIPRLKCRAIVGCANNQLAAKSDGDELYRRGILYAPDFVVNAGGIINVFVEFEGYSLEKALKKADGIFETTIHILRRSQETKRPPYVIADEIAEEIIYASTPKSIQKT